jgi:hypothetical protein
MINTPKEFKCDTLQAMRKLEESVYHIPTWHALKELVLKCVKEEEKKSTNELNCSESGLSFYLKWSSQMSDWCYSIAETFDWKNIVARSCWINMLHQALMYKWFLSHFQITCVAFICMHHQRLTKNNAWYLQANGTFVDLWT